MVQSTRAAYAEFDECAEVARKSGWLEFELSQVGAYATPPTATSRLVVASSSHGEFPRRPDLEGRGGPSAAKRRAVRQGAAALRRGVAPCARLPAGRCERAAHMGGCQRGRLRGRARDARHAGARVPRGRCRGGGCRRARAPRRLGGDATRTEYEPGRGSGARCGQSHAQPYARRDCEPKVCGAPPRGSFAPSSCASSHVVECRVRTGSTRGSRCANLRRRCTGRRRRCSTARSRGPAGRCTSLAGHCPWARALAAALTRSTTPPPVVDADIAA